MHHALNAPAPLPHQLPCRSAEQQDGDVVGQAGRADTLRLRPRRSASRTPPLATKSLLEKTDGCSREAAACCLLLMQARAMLTPSLFQRPTRSTPDYILTYPDDKSKAAAGLQGLVWNISTGRFPINSTVFFSPVTPGKRSKTAFLFHHGHSVCNCSAVTLPSDAIVETQRCR